jgi:hypothetical protein
VLLRSGSDAARRTVRLRNASSGCFGLLEIPKTSINMLLAGKDLAFKRVIWLAVSEVAS